MAHPVRSSLIFLAGTASAWGQTIPVPNFSFEMPPVTRDEQNPFGALPFIDDWDETAVGLHDEDDQNTGVFLNTDFGEPDHITNADLDRLAFISSLNGNAVRQELAELYQPGLTYTLTVAVGTSSVFPVTGNETLEVALFYFDGGTEILINQWELVTASEVSATALIDVVVPELEVGKNDPWVMKPIGILIRPLFEEESGDTEGEGFWNIDFVRLEAVGTPIPAVSTWGLATTALLLATLGTLALGRRTTRIAVP
jgi:hypothetical protein